jgi:hypothetical protein
MNAVHGYAIKFSAVPAKGFDGEKIYRSSYTITGPENELIESVEGTVEHELRGDALVEAQIMGERRLSSIDLLGAHHVYHQSWSMT